MPQQPPPPVQAPYSPRVQRLMGLLKLPADADYRTELENALEERFGLKS